MRSGLDGATSTLYLSGDFDLHVRIHVENADGTPIDLEGRYTNYTVRLPDPNEPIGSLDVTFIRETTEGGKSTSLAPLVTSSSFNEDDLGGYAPLLQLGRVVTFEVALTAVGGARPGDASTLWYEIFSGFITQINWPKWDARAIGIRCSGLAAELKHCKSETAYSYAASTSIETAAQQVLDNNDTVDNSLDLVTLDFPAATGKVLPTTWEPGLQKDVWDQLWSLAQSMGWICYYRYTGQGTAPKLTFFAPARAKATTDMTIAPYDFQSLSIDESEVRDTGYLVYWDSATGQQIIGPFVNTASFNKYGGSRGIHRIFWIKLEENSPIRESTSATDMLNAALLDVADPDALYQARTFPLVFAEVGVDRYEFLEKDRFYEGSQFVSPFTVMVQGGPNKNPVSIVTLRGQPSAGSQTWRSMTGIPGNLPIIMRQYAEDESGTGATAKYDPDVHTHYRESSDNGVTWTRWITIADSGLLAEVNDLTLTEPVANRLGIGVDLSAGAVEWQLYLKKGGWPTTDGLSGGPLDEEYFRTQLASTDTYLEIDFPAGGTYYALARALDANGVIGPRTAYEVSGSPAGFALAGSPAPALQNISLLLVDAPNDYIQIDWDYVGINPLEANYSIDIRRGQAPVATGIDVDENETPGGGSGSYQDTYPEIGTEWVSYTYTLILKHATEEWKYYQKTISDYFQQTPV